jgi:hypothetical protein
MKMNFSLTRRTALLDIRQTGYSGVTVISSHIRKIEMTKDIEKYYTPYSVFWFSPLIVPTELLCST